MSLQGDIMSQVEKYDRLQDKLPELPEVLLNTIQSEILELKCLKKIVKNLKNYVKNFRN